MSVYRHCLPCAKGGGRACEVGGIVVLGAATPRQKKLAPLLFRPSGKSSALLLPFSSPSQTRSAGLWLGNQVAAENKKRDTQTSVSFFGAATQIRTGDLILTKDALYLLSYSSKVHAPMFGACLATAKGLEPSTSGVTGRRSNRLNHAAT